LSIIKYVQLPDSAPPIHIQDSVFKPKGHAVHSDGYEKGKSDLQEAVESEESSQFNETERSVFPGFDFPAIQKSGKSFDNSKTFNAIGLATQIHQKLLDL